MGIDFNPIGAYKHTYSYGSPLAGQTYLYSPEALQEASIFAAQENDNDDFRIIAHRGDSDDAPENTIPALEYAVENGYLTAECDIGWTRDGVPVLIHDNTINRTGRKPSGLQFFVPRKVSSYTYNQLQIFDFGRWFDSDFKGTKIPSLQEVLEFAQENDLELYLDLKDNLDDEKIETLIQLVKDSDMEDKVTWISFNSKNLEKIAEQLPSARLGFLVEDKITDKTIDVLRKLKTESNDVFLDIKYSKITPSGLAKLEEAGFYYEAWTVDSLAAAESLARDGCKGITTNKLHQDDLAEITGSDN